MSNQPVKILTLKMKAVKKGKLTVRFVLKYGIC